MSNTQVIRRRFLQISGAAAASAAGLVSAAAATAGAADKPHRPGREVEVLLAHGAWADASSWSEVIRRLHHHGYRVRGVQLPLRTLEGDVEIVRRAIEAADRPVVLAGHSYGGAVISGAAAGATNVVGLVFVAAFALDAGETLLGLSNRFPPPPALSHLVTDKFGDITVDPAAFPEMFAQDLPRGQASVLAAVQKPLSSTVLGAVGGPAAWREIPSWYQVSTRDRMINPDLQRFIADRIHAHTVELPTSHASLLSRPDAVAQLIRRAATVSGSASAEASRHPAG